MSKFSGIIGFEIQVEKSPGIWGPSVVEKRVSGELVKFHQRNELSGNVNDDLSLSNTVSIVARPDILRNLETIRYIKFSYPKIGGCWKVSRIDAIDYPKLTLEVGGVYNGEQARAAI